MPHPTQPTLEPQSFLIRGQETITVRPVSQADTNRLVDLLARLSPETRWRRYFSTRPLVDDLGWQEAQRLTRAHTADHQALVVTTVVDGQVEIIGTAELVRLAGAKDVGEIALLVRDDYQGQGVGTRLAECLPAVASHLGIRTVRGVTLADNRATQHMLERWSSQLTRVTRLGETSFSLDLNPAPPASPLTRAADRPRPLVPSVQGV